ncbi:MAG: 5-oxoprolinase subunit PxpA [Chitinophagaceae bacterium]
MSSDHKKQNGINEYPGFNSLQNPGKTKCEINCDMGEGAGNDELIMPFIHAVNIACGYHAGDPDTMWRTAELALKHNVSIGAHVSFPDRNNFGRSEMNMAEEEVYELIIQQLMILKEIVTGLDAKIRHVKPHGALYNMSARDASLAKSIARAVKDFDPAFILFGLSGSHSIQEAKKIGLATSSEVFADRTYREDGTLTPRTQPNALIETTEKVIQQVLQMLNEGTVTTVSGKIIPIAAETICIHGDGQHALEFAKAIRKSIQNELND